jgi:GNAT superfamily N-acetyltransferase
MTPDDPTSTPTTTPAPAPAPEVSVRRAVAEDVDAMAAQLAKTFWDDPVIGHLFRNEAKREAGLRAYFGTQMRADYLKFGGCYLAESPQGQCLGSAIWAPAGKPLLTGMVGVLTMFPVLPYVYRNMPRVLGLLNMMERNHPHEPHWYLASLGTAVDVQGKGVGSALMDVVTAHCDQEGLPAYLESSKERNVPFYRRHGFEVTQEFHAPGNGPTLWAMWRDPKGPPTVGATR